MARVYADVNQNMPRSYWDYDSVNISASLPEATHESPSHAVSTSSPSRSEVVKLTRDLGWGVLENYEVVRKIGMVFCSYMQRNASFMANPIFFFWMQVAESTQKSLRESTLSTIRNA